MNRRHDGARGVVTFQACSNCLSNLAGTVAHETRSSAALFLGASPRASLALLNASKAYACINGRHFVTPEDIKTIALPVLRHRVALTPDKEMEGVTTDDIVKQIIDKVEVPR